MTVEQESPPKLKTAAVLAVAAASLTEGAELAASMLGELRRYVVGLLSDADRDVDRIEHEADEEMHFLLGYWGATLRLLVGLRIHTRQRAAEVTIRATKGARDALDDTDWGDQGADVGNTPLVARVFHVGIVSLVSNGVQTLHNHPVNERVQARYVAMGFEAGTSLDLTSAEALARAFNYVDLVYRRYGLSLMEPPP